MTEPHTAKSDSLKLGILLGTIGVGALIFFYSRNEILLSGDAVAHINISRHVFDSRTPGLLQLGSVWLPLPHLLTIPFVVNNRMWQSGIGGSIVSLVSYVLAGLGLFRLLSFWSRAAAWAGTLFFALNPNLLYVQTTALNEPIYLATFIWATVFFLEADRSLRSSDGRTGKWLEKGSIALTAAVLTRYDGWFLACVCWTAMLPSLIKVLRSNRESAFRASVCKAVLLTALAPALWLAYNFGVYGNALEFANGPYSAKAIAQRTTAAGAPPYPGQDHVLTAATYFVKAAQLNLADGFIAKLLVLLAALATALLARKEWVVVVLLWSPLVFYALSIAYGSVPIFLPVWWPFSYYNARYGLELLPAIAAGIAFVVYWIGKTVSTRRATWIGVSVVGFVAAACYLEAFVQVPICLRETRTNGRARMELDRRLAAVLRSLPADATVLAYTGVHSGAFEFASFPLRRTINEGNFVVWDSSLVHPASAADYVVASDGDPVAEAIMHHPERLQLIATVTVEGQSRAAVYCTLAVTQ